MVPLLFQTKLVTEEFLGSHEGFGEEMWFLSSSLLAPPNWGCSG